MKIRVKRHKTILIVISVVMLIVAVIAGWRLRKAPPATPSGGGNVIAPSLSPALEAMRSSAVDVEVGTATPVGQTQVILRDVSADSAWIFFQASVTSDSPSLDVEVRVGQSVEISGCTIAVLEARPDMGQDESHQSAASALVAVDCSAVPVQSSVPPSPDAMTSSGSVSSIQLLGDTR